MTWKLSTIKPQPPTRMKRHEHTNRYIGAGRRDWRRTGHDAGTAGTHWYISINKDLGNGRTRRYYGIGIHVGQWFNLFKREMDRARQGLEPTRYMAVRAREHYWVEPKLCNPVIDSSQYAASQMANQKRMVA